MKNLKFIVILLSFFLGSYAMAYDPTEMSEDDATCLAKAIYHEARGEGERGMFAVAAVIINRTNHQNFSSDICSVVHQRGQFTFDQKAKMSERQSITAVGRVVDRIREGFVPLYDFLYFHRIDVPGQCSSKKVKSRIGSHYFCG